MSAGSKHVKIAGSARMVTLRVGVPSAEEGADVMGRYRDREGSRMRAERFEMVDEVGDASPAPGVCCDVHGVHQDGDGHEDLRCNSPVA